MGRFLPNGNQLVILQMQAGTRSQELVAGGWLLVGGGPYPLPLVSACV